MFEKDGYQLVWADEFTYEGRPDPAKWNYDLGDKWFNNEAQAYVDHLENAFVKDGRLTIQARKEKSGNAEYTSARLTTWERQSWQYGYFEIRAKLSGGAGAWPAFWFMPDAERRGVHWPLCGEIDMMEYTEMNKDVLVYSLHSQNHNHTRHDTKQYSTSVHREGVTEDYHVYGLEWTPEYVEYFFDGESVCRYCKTDDAEDQTERSWPYDQPFYLILNIAVGGFMGGEIREADLPYLMEVDYVKVYQKTV